MSTVNVDVCQPEKMPCLKTGCRAQARFSVQRDDRPPHLYCGPDALNRLGMHQRNGRQIVISDEARELLDKVWSP